VSQRETKMLWLQDLLDHLSDCRRQLEWAEDPAAMQVITETMLHDLDRCRRLCEALQPRLVDQAAN
jgi:hypothetical protein